MDTRFPTSDIDEIGPTNGLLAYYNCDSLQGNTLLDNSGNGNNGINYGATLTSGKSGNALSFNGVSDYVDCGSFSSMTSNNPITLTAWIKFSVSQTGKTILGKHANSPGGASIGIDDTAANKIKFHMDTYAVRVNSTMTLNDDTWHLITGTWDTTTLRLYIDGVLNATNNTPTALTAPPVNLNIGRWVGGSSQYFQGLIDGASIYNKALSDIEIKSLFKLNSKKSTLFTDNYESSLTYNETIELSNTLEGNSVKNLVTGQIIGTSSNVTQNTGYLEFNGTSSYINIGDNARLNTGGTITCWYYARSSGESGAGRIIDKSTDTSATNGYALLLNNDKIDFVINGVNPIIISPSLPSLNTWHHLAVVVAADKKEMWVDGVKVANNTNSSLPPDVAGNVYIGNRANNTDRTFDGYIKNVRIYTRTLDAEEIKFLYNKGK